MKKKIAIAIALSSSLLAVELDIGRGVFHYKSSLASILSANCKLDITTLTLRGRDIALPYNLHLNYSLELYKSKRLDKLTTFFAKPLTYEWPFFGSIDNAIENYTPLTTPTDYKIRGIDFNIALLYPLLNQNGFFISAGVNGGISMPFMKMDNPMQALKLMLTTLKTTKTRMTTYKIGPALQIQYSYENMDISGFLAYNYQTGSIRNSFIDSSADIDGSNTLFDLAFAYHFTPHIAAHLGFSYKKWDTDDIDVTLLKAFSFHTTAFHNDFSIKNFYLGVSYNF